VNFDEFKRAAQAAEDHFQDGRWGVAFDAYRELVRRRLAEVGIAEALHEADLIVIQRLADLAIPFGETAAADHFLAALVDLNRRHGFAGRADLAAIKRLHLALGADRLDVARDLLRALKPSLGSVEELDLSPVELARWEVGRPWSGAERPVLFTQLYLGLGRLLAGLGQYREALLVLERGRSHATAGDPPLARAADLPLRLALAAARLEQGDLPTAASDLGTLVLDERKHPGLAIRRCELLAKLHLLRGELQTAVDLLERGSTICRASRFHHLAPWLTVSLAQVCILLNQTRKAEQLLKTIAAGAEALSDPALRQRVELLTVLAEGRGSSLLGYEPSAQAVVEMQQGTLPAGSPASPVPELTSGSRCDRSASFLAAFEDRALELQIKLSKGDLESTMSLLAALQRDFQITDSPLVHLLLRMRTAMVAYYRGRQEARPEIRDRLLEGVEQEIVEALPSLRHLGLKSELYQAQRFLGWCQHHLARPTAEIDALATANQKLLEEIASSLSAEERATYLVNKWQVGEEALAIELNGIVADRGRMADAGLLRRLALRWKILWRLNAFLDCIHRDREALAREAVGEGRRVRRPGAFSSLGRRLLSHSWRRATLIFLVLPDRVFLAQLGWISLDFKLVPLRRLEVRELVRAWHEAALGVNPAAAGRAVRKLEESLGLGEILERLPPRVRSLTIVPDDALHGFPFAALHYRNGYLVERFALSIAYQSTARSVRRGRETRRRALVAGVDLPIGNLPELPDTGRQLHQVAQWLAHRGVTAATVLNQEVSRSFLLEELSRVGFCHVSCHGVFRPEAPEGTGLVLPQRDGEEQVLSLRDLLGVHLNGTRHITLVSCWAADNFILPGRWIVSLPETLWRRGAGSVMGCLWEVENHFASQFLEDFYLALDRLPRDEALRHAQLCALGNPRTADLLLWAGYQLYGDPGMLRLS
jgi:hypothetical protein